MRCPYSRLILAVALLLAPMFGACTAGQESPSPVERQFGGEISYATMSRPELMNPLLATDVASQFVNARVFASLVRPGPELELEPYLASDWHASTDGLRWTFTLRDGVVWHDGHPFTADDVVFTYSAILHPQYPGAPRHDLGPVTSVDSPEPNIVVFHLEQPFAPLLSRLALGILPAHLFAPEWLAAGGDLDGIVADLIHSPHNQTPVGTGPYRWSDQQGSGPVVLTANTDFFLEGPFIETVRVVPFPCQHSALEALEAGDIDYLGSIPLDRLDDAMERLRESHAFWQLPANAYQYIGLRQDHPIFSDLNVRRALMYGVDRQQLVADVLVGLGSVVNSFLPPVSWAYQPDLYPYLHDPVRAVELLEAAGWDRVGSDGIRHNQSGDRLSFTVLSATGNVDGNAMLSGIQRQWAEIGVEVELRALEWAELLEQHLERGSFEAYQLGWSLGLDPDPYTFFHSSQGQRTADGYIAGLNDVGYANQLADTLMEDGRRQTEPAARAETYRQLQLLLNSDLPYLFLYTRDHVTAVHSRIHGVVLSPLGPVFPELWYIPAP